MLTAGAVILVIAVTVALTRSSGPTQLKVPGTELHIPAADPFGYRGSREADFVARASSASAWVLFAKSPGGAIATARRVAAYRGLIDQVTAGTAIDPATLEAIVFLESAGLPNAIAGTDVSDAAGLTQILAQTGQSLLGMRINLRASRRLTVAIDRAYALGKSGLVAHLQRERATIDDRFDPRKALAATVRYLELAQGRFGRADLAVVSYHMGIGNLQQVLGDYDGGRSVPYPQLYFDTAPDRLASAFNLLHSFGDDSSLYYWRVLGAEQIMRLYRSDPAAIARLASLETAQPSDEEVLHPPDHTQVFADPGALRAAYASRAILALPSSPAQFGLAYAPGIGSLARRLNQPAALYRGLRGPALEILLELGLRVRALSGGAGALTVTSAVTDTRYQRLLNPSSPGAPGEYSLYSTGYAFDISRQYASHAQALAFQAMLDRLQALNLIAWEREPSVIHITVAGDAASAIAHGP